MSLDQAVVARIAHLARIRLSAEERAQMANELNHILSWVERLNGVDTTGVAPLTSVTEQQLRWRADVVDDGGDPEKILANAPDAAGDFFAVPKVVE